MSTSVKKSVDVERDEENPPGWNSQQPQREYDAFEASSSEPLWNLYNNKAAEYDEWITTRLKSDMEGLLIFAGLFSATVTAFIIESYKTLSIDPSDNTVYYLAQISQQLSAIANGSSFALSTASQSIPPPDFPLASTAVIVNTLWVLSLVFSLICALGATLVQVWVHEYKDAVLGANNGMEPHVRAKRRAYWFEGIDGSRLEYGVLALPTLLHIALFLFLAGLVVFFFPINLVIARILLAVVAAFGFIYLVLTCVPYFVPNSPLGTPLTLPAIYLPAFILVILWVICAIGLTIVVIAISIAFCCWCGSSKFLDFIKDAFDAVSDLGDRVWEVVDDWRTNKALKSDPGQETRAIQWLSSETQVDSQLLDLVRLVGQFLSSGGEKNTSIVVQAGTRWRESGFPERMARLLSPCVERGRLPENDRRSRIVLCSQVLWLLARHSSVEDRLSGPWWSEWCGYSMVSSLVTLKCSWDLNGHHRAQVELQDKVPPSSDVGGIKPDFMISVHLQCMNSLLAYRAIMDFTRRVRTGDIKIYAHSNWSVKAILARIQGSSRPQLQEVVVAAKLMCLILLPLDPIELRALPYETEKLEVYIEPAKIAQQPIPPISAERIANEGGLICLLEFLRFVCGIWLATPTEQAMIVDTARIILEGWDMGGIPTASQEELTKLFLDSPVLKQAMIPLSSVSAEGGSSLPQDDPRPLKFPPDLVALFYKLLDSMETGNPLSSDVTHTILDSGGAGEASSSIGPSSSQLRQGSIPPEPPESDTGSGGHGHE